MQVLVLSCLLIYLYFEVLRVNHNVYMVSTPCAIHDSA